MISLITKLFNVHFHLARWLSDDFVLIKCVLHSPLFTSKVSTFWWNLIMKRHEWSRSHCCLVASLFASFPVNSSFRHCAFFSLMDGWMACGSWDKMGSDLVQTEMFWIKNDKYVSNIGIKRWCQFNFIMIDNWRGLVAGWIFNLSNQKFRLELAR